MNFSERLKETRKIRGLTQAQLAAQLGVAKTTITSYETGNREPDLFKIKRLIGILNVDAEYLLCMDEKDPTQTMGEVDLRSLNLANTFKQLNETGKQRLEEYGYYQLKTNPEGNVEEKQ